MTGMTDDELLREIQDLVEAKRAEKERWHIEPYEDPKEFGRRIARETFEKHMERSEDQASKLSD